jgi:hypothetical protein
MRNLFSFYCLLLFLSSGCNTDTSSHRSDDALFVRLGKSQTGISFENTNFENEKNNILTYEYFYNGAGVAVGDVNNDGLPDLFFSSNNTANRLYLNKGNFRFEDVSEKAGIAGKGWRTGVTMADVNADGWLDIYICRSADNDPEKRRNLLFINTTPLQGGNEVSFSEKAAEFDIDDDSFTSQAVFFDMDKDGDLDLFTLNHSHIFITNKVGIDPVTRKKRQDYISNRLFRNDEGKFTDISEQAGIEGGISNYGLGVIAADFNADGWTDLYATNDFADEDHLYLNNGNGTFTNAIKTATGHLSFFTMGADAADINRDGLLDFYTADMLPEDNKRQKLLFGPHEYEKHQTMIRNELQQQFMRNMLQINNGDGTFSEIGQIAGVSNTDWSWAPLFADYDLDGWNDLFVTNGYKRDFTNMDFLKFGDDMDTRYLKGEKLKNGLMELIKKMPSNITHNYVFRNRGNLLFEDVTEAWGFSEPILSNGAAYADLDLDGDLDIVVNNLDKPASIYRNMIREQNPEAGFIQFILKGNPPNTMGIGAKVRLYQDGHIDERELQPVRGFQSGVDFTLHFGLGENETIDSALVIWHSGKYQKLENPVAGQTVVVEEKNANLNYSYKKTATEAFFTPTLPPLIAFSHLEDEFVDFHLQSTLPCFQSRQGPHAATADVNGDGLSDLFITGAKGQASQLWIQQPKAGFRQTNAPVFEKQKEKEDVDATFADFDADGDADLSVVSGGYYLEENSWAYQPRIYLNDGKGNFSASEDALPNLDINASVVLAEDFDADGDKDLFIGCRLKPKSYPMAAPSAILLNDGKGHFTDVTLKMLPDSGVPGMVTDASWLEKERKLVIVGEWMAITILDFSITSTAPVPSSSIPNSAGWWSCIESADLDNDGDTDFIVGNWGMNNQMKVDSAHPAIIRFGDFDNNGVVDPFLGYTIQGELYPGLSLDELASQVPSFKKRFTSYEVYSNVNFEGVLTAEQKKDSKDLYVNNFHTCILVNNGQGNFSIKNLPVEAQISPVYAILVLDANLDGKPDLLLGGNQSNNRISIGKMDANYGLLLLGDGKNNFKALPQRSCGLSIRGDVKDFILLKNKLMVLKNNAAAEFYALKGGG